MAKTIQEVRSETNVINEGGARWCPAEVSVCCSSCCHIEDGVITDAGDLPGAAKEEIGRLLREGWSLQDGDLLCRRCAEIEGE